MAEKNEGYKIKSLLSHVKMGKEILTFDDTENDQKEKKILPA